MKNLYASFFILISFARIITCSQEQEANTYNSYHPGGFINYFDHVSQIKDFIKERQTLKTLVYRKLCSFQHQKIKKLKAEIEQLKLAQRTADQQHKDAFKAQEKRFAEQQATATTKNQAFTKVTIKLKDALIAARKELQLAQGNVLTLNQQTANMEKAQRALEERNRLLFEENKALKAMLAQYQAAQPQLNSQATQTTAADSAVLPTSGMAASFVGITIEKF